ncbi:MAG: 50S ribosomal protein L11 [Candidatus Thermoplasmatota archaeon]
MPETIELLVDGGKASAGPPIGPALGPLGVNVIEVVNRINERTRAFTGMKVPVKLVIDPKTKSVEISVGTPPTSALVIKELGIEKGSGSASTTKVGNLTIGRVRAIAEMKTDSLLGRTLKERMLEVAGTCVSMGVTIEGKDPRVVQREIREGLHDTLVG